MKRPMHRRMPIARTRAALPAGTALALAFALVGVGAFAAACGSDASSAGGGGSTAVSTAGGSPGSAGGAGSPPVDEHGGHGGSAPVGLGLPCAERLAAAKEGYAIDDRLPDFATIDEAGASHRARDQQTSCDDAPGLALLRIDAAFCGPCALAADAVQSALAPVAAIPGASAPLTVLYADEDGGPAIPRDATRFRTAHPTLPGQVFTSDDPALIAAVGTHHVLPLWLILDARTGVVLDVLTNPAPDRLAPAVADAWESVTGEKIAVPKPSAAKIDGRFRPDEWALVQQMRAPASVPPPPSPSNAHADDPAAASLGAALFADASLGGAPDVAVSCASCHQAEKGFADGLAVPLGKASGTIHTPAIALAAHQRWQFWDGRADSLWSQALGPIENPIEMAGTRLGVVARIKKAHAPAYEAVFGPLPSTDLPTSGKPGDAAWDTLPPADREAATRVFVNVGKAIEAFERTLARAVPTTRFDAYVTGETTALTDQERDGLALFLGAGCASCHHGPTLSDSAFHDLLVPSHQAPADRGRLDGLPTLLASPFRADGSYSDDASAGARLAFLESSPRHLGQIKTPTLRNVKNTGPWGHGGSFESLGDVVRHYGNPRKPAIEGGLTVGVEDPTLGAFATTHAAAIEAFLGTLLQGRGARAAYRTTGPTARDGSEGATWWLAHHGGAVDTARSRADPPERRVRPPPDGG